MFHVEHFGLDNTFGQGSLDGASLSGPVFYIDDWRAITMSLGMAIRGSNTIIDGSPGAVAEIKVPTDSTVDLRLHVCGDANQAGDELPDPLYGITENMATVGALFDVNTVAPYTKELVVVDLRGWIFTCQVQTLGLPMPSQTGRGSFTHDGRSTVEMTFDVQLGLPAGHTVGVEVGP